MTASTATPLVRVPVMELDESWVGEPLLVTHRAGTCTHIGGLSDLEPGPSILNPTDDWSVTRTRFLFLGGELVLVTADDVVVAAPTPTALEGEPLNLAASPYDR